VNRTAPDPTSNDRANSVNTGVAGWLWAVGAAVLVFAARNREIHLHAGVTPYLDQWRVEAQQIIVPWLKGQLSWTAFFSPHHEHIPLWTRLIAWLQAVVLGRWDAQLQCSFNAALWGATVGLWSHWFRRLLPRLPALLLTLMAIALAALPHGWENSTWGFQSHVPLALLFVTWYLAGSLGAMVFTPRWWFAQAAGLAAFFTFGSMWAAPLAALLVLWWTGTLDRRRGISAGLLAALGLLLLLYARAAQPHVGALAQTTTSLPQFLAAFLVQLGWPSQWLAAGALLHLPVVLLAWRIRGQPQGAAIDRIVLAVALWAVAQATAFAYARGGAGWIGFVSRYGDLLALGVLANAVALWRLLQGLPRWRPWLAVLALVWSAAVAQGLHWVSTRGHTEYFHTHSALWGLFRRDAVHDYLATNSPDTLSRIEVRNLLYPDPDAVATMLATPGLAELLPVALRPNAVRARGDFVSAAASRIREIWPILATSGALLLFLGLSLPRSKSTSITAALNAVPTASPLRWLVVLSAGSTALVFLWPMPLEFNPRQRWERMLTPPDYVGPLSFLITTPTTYAVDNLTGGASLWPEDFRNTFYGTHIDGPGFTGTAQSSTFALNSPWLVVPVAGFPASTGNRISLRVEDAAGLVLAEIVCAEPNPTQIAFWTAEVSAFNGRLGRLVFTDGRTDSEGWIAAAAPQPATNENAGQRLNTAWSREQTTGAHRSIGIIALALIVTTVFTGVHQHRKQIAN
jgi:hypothetical protein